MDIGRTENEKEIVFFLTGSLTNAPELVSDFFDRLGTEVLKSKKDIAFDLSKVNFIDSIGIGLLVGILIKSHELNITVRLRNMQTLVRHILDSTRVKKIFPDLY